MALAVVKERPYKNRQADGSGTIYNRSAIYSGRGYDFNGTTSKIAVSNNPGSVKTVCFWVNPDNATTAILELTGSASISLASNVVTTSGFTSPTIYVGLQSTSNYVTTGVHTFVAITPATAISASAINIGKAGASFLDGKLSNVMMFDTALTVSQLEEVFSNPENPIPAALTSSNLLLWYPLQENQTTPKYIFDASPGRNVGVPTACTTVSNIAGTYQTAAKGYSKKGFFDGTDDYIALGSIASTATVTFSFWFIADSFASSQYICSFGDYKISLSSSTTITVYPDGATGTAIALGQTLSTKKLYHCSIVQTGTTATLRINAQSLAVSATVTAATTASATSYIGRSGSNYFNGFIEDFAVWPSVVSATNLTSIYGGVSPTTVSGTSHYYKNTNSTTWANSANPGTNTGTATGSPTTATIPEGLTAGKDLNGFPLQYTNNNYGLFNADGYTSAPSNSTLEITTSVTIDLWVKITTAGVAYCLLNKRNMYALRVLSTNVVRFQTYSGGTYRNLDTTATLTAGTWYHIAGTYTTGATNIYINGVLSVTSAAFTGSITSSTYALEIGREYDNTERLDGYVDEVKIYNAAVAAADVLKNYRANSAAHT